MFRVLPTICVLAGLVGRKLVESTLKSAFAYDYIASQFTVGCLEFVATTNLQRTSLVPCERSYIVYRDLFNFIGHRCSVSALRPPLDIHIVFHHVYICMRSRAYSAPAAAS